MALAGTIRERAGFVREGPIAVDTETTGLNPWAGHEPFAVVMTDIAGTSRYWEWDVDPFTRAVLYDDLELEEIAEILGCPTIPKTMFNKKFDLRMLRKAGIETLGRVDDVMFMAHTCNTSEPNFKLKRLARVYADYPDDDQKELDRVVNKCRRMAKKLDWKIGYEEELDIWGVVVEAAETAADKWLPRALSTVRVPGPKGTSVPYLTPEEVCSCKTYAIGDGERTQLLHAMYVPAIKGAGLTEIYEREILLDPITQRMEDRGVRVHRGRTEAEVRKCKQAARQALNSLKTMSGNSRFNPDAAVDVRKLLFEKLKLKITAYTEKSREPAVNADALRGYADQPAVQLVGQYRAMTKAYASFFRHYLEAPFNPREGVYLLHPDFNQVGPVTGRYSCRKPNLQNVANSYTTRGLVPIQARMALGPRPGHWWLHADYSQLEVRIFAEVSNDPTLLEALKSGKDLHSQCALKAWGGVDNSAAIRQSHDALELWNGSPSSEKVKEAWARVAWSPAYRGNWERMNFAARKWLGPFDWDIVEAEASLDKKNARGKAKMVLFAKVFGGGKSAIADLLQCSEEEARQFLADYDVAFPRIKEYTNELVRECRKTGYVETVLGRRIQLEEDAEYRCVNYKVQGSAADLLKQKMRELDREWTGGWTDLTGGWIRLPKGGGWSHDPRLLLTIHDELVTELQINPPMKLLEAKKRIMEDTGRWFKLIELPTEFSWTKATWDAKEKIAV